VDAAGIGSSLCFLARESRLLRSSESHVDAPLAEGSTQMLPSLPTLSGPPVKLAELVLEVLHDFLDAWLQGKARAIRVLKESWPVTVYVLAAGVLVLWSVWSLFHMGRSVFWRLSFWICFTSASVTLLPTVSKSLFGARPRLSLVLQIAVLAVSLTLFATRLLHLPFIHHWTFCAVLLVFLLSRTWDRSVSPVGRAKTHPGMG
jgi:hypothetical protein